MIEQTSLRQIGTKKDVRLLVDLLNDLAAQTWHKISVGPSRGLAFGEESLTDHNLFDLDRLGAPIEVYKFDKTEEPYNGADFEWWVGSDTAHWLGLRFQAKKLDDDGIYAQLGHRVRGRRQYELLLEQAQRDNVWAFYCFYNGWPGLWPKGVPNAGCRRKVPVPPVPRGSAQKACVHAYLEDFGCAIAPASAVARRHQGEPRNGRRALEEHLRYSRPWSHLFGDRKNDVGQPSQIVRELPAQLWDWTASASDIVSSNGQFASGLPEGQGLHEELPIWLQARRVGATSQEGYRPAVAVVFNVS